jgi:hypothetical protein
MNKLNAAQQILLACGVEGSKLLLGHHKEKSPQYCKKGPGRIHQQGGKPRQGSTHD